MISLKFAFWWRKNAFAVLLPSLLASSAFGDVAVRPVAVTEAVSSSHVPEPAAQGRFLAPQAISCVDVSADGKFITVGTMAFSHDSNVWQFAPDGTVLARLHF